MIAIVVVVVVVIVVVIVVVSVGRPTLWCDRKAKERNIGFFSFWRSPAGRSADALAWR